MAEQSRSLRNPPEHTVVLSTFHSAKGLEWDTVFMVGVEDGVLPHINANDIEEERRVTYVGTTRARRRLGLTYAGERYAVALSVRDGSEREAHLYLDRAETGRSGQPPATAHAR